MNDYNELYDMARAELDNAVTAVFEKLQEVFGGFLGDCPPDLDYKLELMKDDMAELIAHAAHMELTND